jgi:hypothetical protein
MEPVPSVVVLELVDTSELGSDPGSRFLDSTPKKFGTPILSPLVRERFVSLSRLALSVTLTFTVTMSPTCWARWSLKKAREPVRQSELAA